MAFGKIQHLILIQTLYLIPYWRENRLLRYTNDIGRSYSTLNCAGSCLLQCFKDPDYSLMCVLGGEGSGGKKRMLEME